MKHMCEDGGGPNPIIAEGDMNRFVTAEKANPNEYQHSEQKIGWI
jgi:hypothetical protein